MKHTITIITENKPGALYAITGMFVRRRINISRLHVEEIDPTLEHSRCDIDFFAEPDIVAKVAAQLEKIVEVVEVEAGVKVEETQRVVA